MTSPTYLRLLRDAPHSLPAPIERERGERLRPKTLLYADTVAVEFLLSLVSLSCGLWILLPFDLFATPFPVLASLFSEPLCGVWLVGLGASRLILLWQGRRRYRQGCAFFAFLTWMNLAAWVIVTDAQRLTLLFFMLFSLTSLWVFLRGPSRIAHRVVDCHKLRGRHD